MSQMLGILIGLAIFCWIMLTLGCYNKARRLPGCRAWLAPVAGALFLLSTPWAIIDGLGVSADKYPRFHRPGCLLVWAGILILGRPFAQAVKAP